MCGPGVAASVEVPTPSTMTANAAMPEPVSVQEASATDGTAPCGKIAPSAGMVIDTAGGVRSTTTVASAGVGSAL